MNAGQLFAWYRVKLFVLHASSFFIHTFAIMNCQKCVYSKNSEIINIIIPIGMTRKSAKN